MMTSAPRSRKPRWMAVIMRRLRSIEAPTTRAVSSERKCGERGTMADLGWLGFRSTASHRSRKALLYFFTREEPR